MHGMCQFKNVLTFQCLHGSTWRKLPRMPPEVGKSRHLAGRGIAAVGVQDLSGHVARILAGEEQEGGRDFVRLARAADRRVLAKVLEMLGRLPAEGVERSPDRTRRNAVHADAFLDEVLGEGARERSDRSLRCAVVEQL